MSNTIRHRRTCQTWHQKDCKPADYIVNDPVKQIEALPKKHRTFLNYILELENKNYKEVYPNQTTLGNVMDCGRQRANEIVGELQEIGLIVTNYRHMDSCLYKTSSFLRNPFMAQKLSHIFPSLKKLLLLLAIPCFGEGVEGEATQLNLKNYNVYRYTEKCNLLHPQMQRMNHHVNKYSPLHQCLARLPLTLEQKCIFGAYPEWLIDQALFKITDMSMIEDLGAYLYAYCSKRCKKPDWIWSSKLKDLYKDEHDYRKMPLQLNENEFKDAYLPTVPAYKKPEGKFPQKGRQEYQSAEPRRSPGGISPEVITQRPSERLLSLGDLKNKIDEYKALPDKVLGTLFAKGLMARQDKLISELTPQELDSWMQQ